MGEQTFQRVAPGVIASTSKKPALTKRTNGKVDKRTRRVLVVVRESSAAAFSEFVKMLEAVLNSRVSYIPGAAKMVQLGDLLVRKTPEGEALRRTLNAEPKYVRGSKVPVGWLFDVEGTLFFLGLYSAGKPTIRIDEQHNVEVTNEFTRALGSIVEQYNVGTIYTGPLSRLLRSRDVSAGLQNALKKNSTKVICSDQSAVFDMGTVGGKRNFDMAAWMVEEQYKGIVAGLTNGTYRVLLRGQWPKNEDHLPAMGYKLLSKEDPTPIPDLTYLDLVKEFITLAAKDESEVSNDDLVSFLGKRGWGSRALKVRQLNDEQGTILDSKHPRMALRHLLEKGLPLWETGIYNYEVNVPAALLNEQLLDETGRFTSGGQRSTYEEVAQKEDGDIEEEADDTGVYQQNKLGFGISFHHEMLPEGRWADPELIKLAKRRFSRTIANVTGRLATDIARKPLTSIAEWRDEENEYKLASGAADLYWIVSRPIEDVIDSRGRRNGWPTRLDKYIVAAAQAAVLHKTFAEAVVDTLSRSSVTVSRKNPNDIHEKLEVHIDDITENLNKERRKQELALRAGDAAIEAGATSVASRKFKEAEEASVLVSQLEEKLSQAYAQAENARPLEIQTAEISELSAILAELAETERLARPQLNSGMRRLVARLEAKLSENNLNINFQVWVRLVTSDGPVVAGPISFTVPNRRLEFALQRHEEAARYVLADGLRETDAMTKSGYNSLPHMRRRITKLLADVVPSTYLRSAIVDCPIVETKAVVWEMLDASLNGRAFVTPEGVDRAFATHIRNTYGSSDFPWTVAWASQSHELPRLVLEYVLACGPEGARALDLQKYASTLGGKALIQNFIGLSYRGMRKGEGYEPILERGENFRKNNPERRFLALRCTFCDSRTLTHTLKVPEVPGGLLCTECRRAPSLPSITFPEAYLRNWDGPLGRSLDGKLSGTNGTIEG